MYVVNEPNVNTPVNEPIPLIEPTHDNCSFVKMPVANGVADDNKTGKAGENHPIMQP